MTRRVKSKADNHSFLRLGRRSLHQGGALCYRHPWNVKEIIHEIQRYYPGA